MQDRMIKDSSSLYRPRLHVQLYLWVGLLIVSIAPALLISGELFDTTHFAEGLITFVVLLIAFQVLLWYARRRCSSQELSAWDGLLYIATSLFFSRVVGMGWVAVHRFVHDDRRGRHVVIYRSAMRYCRSTWPYWCSGSELGE